MPRRPARISRVSVFEHTLLPVPGSLSYHQLIGSRRDRKHFLFKMKTFSVVVLQPQSPKG
jgi:hypothetical protein